MYKILIGLLMGIYIRSLAGYIYFYGAAGAVYWFVDLGELVHGLFTLDTYLIGRCFTTLFLN